MRCSVGFEPAWFHHRCKADFSESWHRDPVIRHNSLRTLRDVLRAAFPGVEPWGSMGDEALATLSGCYGAYVIPRVFGLPLRYAPDRWPQLEPGSTLSVQQIEQLEPQRLLSSPAVEELFEQMNTMERRWGRIHGYLNWQGVLNNALHIRGQEIFLDIHDRPDLARHLFRTACETMILLARAVQERQRRSGFHVDHFCVSNCTVNMVSPQVYRAFLLPLDATIALSFERFGVHTCDWNVTPYIDALKELPKLGYLDMGMQSDMRRVRETVPWCRRAVMYPPVRLEHASWEDIRADFEKIRRDLSPCDIVLADITVTTPDERVRQVLDLCRQLEAAPS